MDRPRSFIDGHLGGFHLLAIVQEAALKSCVQCISGLFKDISTWWPWGAVSSVSPKFNFLISLQCCFVIDSPCFFPPTSCIGKPLPLMDYGSWGSLCLTSGALSTPLTAPGQALCISHLDDFIHHCWVSLCLIWPVSKLPSTWLLLQRTWRDIHCPGIFVRKVPRHLPGIWLNFITCPVNSNFNYNCIIL